MEQHAYQDRNWIIGSIKELNNRCDGLEKSLVAKDLVIESLKTQVGGLTLKVEELDIDIVPKELPTVESPKE